MITYHVSSINRGKGGSAIRSSAYLSRSKLFSKILNEAYDYSCRDDLIHQEIMLPSYAPNDFMDREFLWNSVEEVEKNINSRLARTIYFALPRNLTKADYIHMVRNHVQQCFVDRGMCCDLAIHDKGDNNVHAHVLLTTRSLTNYGHWKPKEVRNYLLDDDGNKIYDENTGRYKRGPNIKFNNWDNRENATIWRKHWADEYNHTLERLGIAERVTHLSYSKQGIKIIPTIHLGARVIALEKQGIKTDRGNVNREILAINQKKEQIINELQRATTRDQYHVLERERTFSRSR